MKNTTSEPLKPENSYFIRIKGSSTYVHFRYRKYILKPTINGACMFESSFADQFLQSEGEYKLEKVPVIDALQE
jgi:hypothetical protein